MTSSVCCTILWYLLIVGVEGYCCISSHSVELLWTMTYNTQKRHTSLPPAGFEPKIPSSELPQTHALDLAATRSGFCTDCGYIYNAHDFFCVCGLFVMCLFCVCGLFVMCLFLPYLLYSEGCRQVSGNAERLWKQTLRVQLTL